MKKKIKRLAVIPARGGSKRLKNKNILPLAGKPLISYTIDLVQETGLFDKILLSTDSDEIASIGKSLGVEVYRRPAKFASDTATVLEALLKLMKDLEAKGEVYDVICQTLPTCLFKKVDHFRQGMAMLDEKTDSVVSISPYEFPLGKSLQKRGEIIKPFWKNSPLLSGKTRTQDQELFYHDNGAFYITWWESMKKYKNFYKGLVKGFEIHPLNAIDIDDQIDFTKAQILLNHMKANPKNPLKKWLSHL